MNIKNSMLDNVIYKQLDWNSEGRRMNEGRLPRKIWNGVHIEKEEREDL